MPKISEYANGDPPVDTDQLVGARAGVNVSWLWSNIKSTLKTYFDTLYLALVAPGTDGNVLTAASGLWTSAAAAAGVSAASQAEQETGTATNVYVSPGRQQYHASAVKAWINFDGTGTPAILASFNVGSLTDNGEGDYTINFTTNFSSANYGFSMGSRSVNGSVNTGFLCVSLTTAPTAGAFRVILRPTGDGSGTAPDSAFIGCSFFGDQ